MANKVYNLVVFGASGFTGQFVVEEVARKTNDIPDFKWAVAGRNEEKLKNSLQKASQITGHDLSSIDTVIANITDENSLQDMCLKSSLILNCVGPYRLFGEQVVKACVENGSHYIDISGEPWFLELMQINYNTAAADAGVYVIGACGFDSIPAEFGLLFTKHNFPGILNTVESYIKFHTGPKGGKVNFGTWHSAVFGIGSVKQLTELRQKNKKQPLPRYTPKLQKRGSYFFNEDQQQWCIPFFGADASIVRRTQRFMHEEKETRPIQYGAYFNVGGLFNLLCLVVGAVIFASLAKFNFGRNLLLKYPGLFSMGIFSKEGPSREQVEGSSFSMLFVGEGFSSDEVEKTGIHDTRIATEIIGPEPGYISTPIAMVQSALTLLQEQDKIPGKGGVLTAGSAFCDTSLLERLRKNGLKFTVLDGRK